MVDIQVVLLYLRGVADKAREFDWSRLIPRGRVEKYQYGVVGFEFTLRPGFGVGFGLGTIDLWLGWPRLEPNLHRAGCTHDPVKSVEPFDS